MVPAEIFFPQEPQAPILTLAGFHGSRDLETMAAAGFGTPQVVMATAADSAAQGKSDSVVSTLQGVSPLPGYQGGYHHVVQACSRTPEYRYLVSSCHYY